ncbi:M16 family metallopeptidase [Bacteroidota bacterium]
MEYTKHQLSNGIQLVHKHTDSKVAHLGVFINAGSRDEFEEEHGLAHFIEHLLFKGTSKRRAYHIISRLEDVGGEINAYTTKEETCIYASFLKEDYNRALELMSDILFNSSFPEKEIKKEKAVILDEINSYKDSPSELIFDEFEELVFNHAPIGRNILGSVRNIALFNKESIHRFMDRNYTNDKIVITSVGDIHFDKLLSFIATYFSAGANNANNRQRKGHYNYIPRFKEIEKNTFQAHCVLGNMAYDLKDEKRIPLVLLNNVLGGPNLNSRLNLTLREKLGLAYHVESNFQPYSDTGIFNIYFGTDRENLKKCMNQVQIELRKLRENKLGEQQLKKAKRQLIGQVAIGADNNESIMLANGKSYMIYSRIDSFEEIKEKIDRITSDDLQWIANDIFNPEKLSFLIYR